MKNCFYVYEHVRKSNGTVFYVGKGFGKRAYTKNNRNKYWHNIVNKHGFEPKFIAQELDEELAFLVETERIDQLKRLGVKLCNMTNGGEGMSGYVASKETREKLSKAHKGRKISKELSIKFSAMRKGKTKSDEFKRKISIANKGRKRTQKTKELISDVKSKSVICVETGIEYKNSYVASEKTNISRSGIGRVCRGQRKTAGRYHWRFK